GSLFYCKNADLYQTIDWLNTYKSELNQLGFKIEQQLNKKYFIGSQNIEIDFSDTNDWFDLKVVITFGEFKIPFVNLKKYITNNQREFILPNGDIAIIPESWFAKYYSLFEYSDPDDQNIKLKKHHVGILQALWQNADHRLKTWEEKLKDFVEPTPVDLPLNFKTELRKYQKEGYDWMNFLKANSFGGILADDMGLGKTIQTLCLLQKEKENSSIVPKNIKVIEESKEQGQLNIFEDKLEVMRDVEHTQPNKTSLLIVPTSLVYNWKNEATKFAPEINILIHGGTHRIRDIQYLTKFDLVITTYGILRSDADLFKEYEFNYIILDESQAAKNPTSVTAKSLLKLRGLNKLALSGTPVENSVTDLWTQMNFVNPGLLGSFNYFIDEFANPIEKENNQEKAVKLQQIIKPFVLRRTKEMVATDLPEKTEYIRYCEMDEDQKNYYEETKSYYRNEILESIENDTFIKNTLSVLQGLTKLR
ncbi:MAG: ATP-dependent helicase, partial [Bacteroidetes bacterium]|nr:ATP-dependent helicase [Bacteroidota bacterium]